MKTDISSRADIEKMVFQFYELVKADNTISFIFTDVVQMNWEKHIPVIVDFWETILLDNPVYKKNAMEVHYNINKQFPLHEKHFAAWLKIFNETLDEYFAGEKVLLAKKRAAGIAQLMMIKMNLKISIP